MSKGILMSIQPKWVCEILNGRKTIEVRRKFPKDYVGWVYIYCTKSEKEKLCYTLNTNKTPTEFENWEEVLFKKNYSVWKKSNWSLNGKIVARFWCDKVEELTCDRFNYTYSTETLSVGEFRVKSCLLDGQLYNYLEHNNGYAIHISKLKIFDKPKEITYFRKKGFFKRREFDENGRYIDYYEQLKIWSLTKAPQNYCYVESEE